MAGRLPAEEIVNDPEPVIGDVGVIVSHGTIAVSPTEVTVPLLWFPPLAEQVANACKSAFNWLASARELF